MSSCKVVSFLYSLVPERLWRAFLIRVHFERCPHCQKKLASAAEARSLFVQEADIRPVHPLWGDIARSLAARDDEPAERSGSLFGRRLWRWAAAGIVLVLLAGYWAWKGFRPDGRSPMPTAPVRFELEYVRVGGQPADAYVYQPQGSDLIIVWAGKPR
jgi:hypothetical protein